METSKAMSKNSGFQFYNISWDIVFREVRGENHIWQCWDGVNFCSNTKRLPTWPILAKLLTSWSWHVDQDLEICHLSWNKLRSQFILVSVTQDCWYSHLSKALLLRNWGCDWFIISGQKWEEIWSQIQFVCLAWWKQSLKSPTYALPSPKSAEVTCIASKVAPGD